MPRAAGEDGYAMVAAVASMAVFALIALMVIEAGRGTTVATGAELDRARAAAAAEAGTALALRGLLDTGPGGHWPIDGRTRYEHFGDAALAIRIEDERGKIPLNALEDEQATAMFKALGVPEERIGIVTDSFLDWLDDDDDERPDGAESAYYQARGIRPRNGPLRSIGETALIRGFDAALVARLEQVATVHFGNGSFVPGHATPLAIQVMKGEEEGAVDIIERQRELAGQRTAIGIGEEASLVGRPLTVRVEARLANGARAERHQLVILTGRAAAPYVIRESD